jgi:hypothetical protein
MQIFSLQDNNFTKNFVFLSYQPYNEIISGCFSFHQLIFLLFALIIG